MLNSRTLFPGLFLIFFLLSCDVQQPEDHSGSFSEMLTELDDAIQLFVNGEPESFKNMWLHSRDVTISGGLGGLIEKGWDELGSRLDMVSGMYGENDAAYFETEPVRYNVEGRTGYLIQHERIRIENEADNEVIHRNYRTTMIFIYQHGEWKITHRHADLHTVQEESLGE